MPEAKVICCIQAFDCEKTIEAAMESVLNQSYPNWLCFLLSNGNKATPLAPNRSFDVIKAFAARDRRFIVVNKKTNDLRMYFWMLCHLANRFPHSYLCTLDADDEYAPDFFERGIALAEAYDLDITACGTDIILKKRAGDKKGKLLVQRQLKENLIVPAEEFTEQFLIYKPFFNEMWGKLFRAKLLRRKNYEQYVRDNLEGRFLADTLLSIHCLERSRKIGVLSGTCHRFFQYEQRTASNATLLANAGVANQKERSLKKSRFSVYDTYDDIMTFLHNHGELSPAVTEYTQAVLFGWFWDYYTRTLLPTQDEKHVASLAARLVFHPKFDELMCYRGSGKYNNLRNYQERLAFCQNLRCTLIGQQMVRNRKLPWRENLPCSPATRRKLDRIIDKLEGTIQILSKLQEECEL